ncbi:MAG: 5'-nucleotidase [Leeuwenhoekiella sp.]
MIRFFIFVSFLSLIACGENKSVTQKITASQTTVSDSIPADAEIEAFIAPYKNRIDQEMDSVLAYAPATYTKSNGEYNTAIGNMMADAVLELADTIFAARTGKHIDAVLLNSGGIRAPINKGNITTRSAYQLMPFENSLVVVELDAQMIQAMFEYLSCGKAHPISGMEIELDDNGKLANNTIHGEPLDDSKTYFIATSDYLQNGGDGMEFLTDPVSKTDLDYKIRNILIDYFSKYDTIAPVRDSRFIKRD